LGKKKRKLKQWFSSIRQSEWTRAARISGKNMYREDIISINEALRRRDATGGIDRSGKWNWLHLDKEPKDIPRHIIHKVYLAYQKKKGSIQKRALNFSTRANTKAVAKFVARVVVNELLVSVIHNKPQKLLRKCLQAWIHSGGSLDAGKCSHFFHFLFPKKKKNVAQAAKYARIQRAIIRWIARDLAIEIIRAFFVLSFDVKSGAPIFAAAHRWRRAEKKLHAYTHCLEPSYGGRPHRFAIGRLVPKAGMQLSQKMNCRLVQRGSCLGAKRGVSGASLNEVLLALTFETKRQPALLGAGGPGALDRIWRALRTLRRQNHTSTYHLVTLDVRSCYDSIDQKRVFQLAAQTLQESQYVIIGSQGRKRGRALCDSISARALKRARCVSRDAMLAELKDFIFNHHVSCGFGARLRYFKQISGISQGGTVSPLLCDLYFADFERSILTSTDSLLRVVDDTLGISTTTHSLCTLVNFYQAATPDLGIHLRTKKTKATFSLPSLAAQQSTSVSFCGLEIDTRLRIKRCHRPFHSKYHRGAPFLSRVALDTRLRRYLHTQLHPIFFDLLLHSRAHALKNLRHAFEETFARVNGLWQPFRNPTVTRTQLHDLAKFAAAIYRRSQRKFNLSAGGSDHNRQSPLCHHDFFQACYLAFDTWLFDKEGDCRNNTL